MSYYEDKVICVCDANKRFELFDTEPISGYIALSKINLVFNFYNIKAPQEVLFCEGGEILVESETPLEEYKAKKKKLIDDVGAAMVAYLSKNKELKEATEKWNGDEIAEVVNRRYMTYTQYYGKKFYYVYTNNHVDILGDKKKNHYNAVLIEERKKEGELVNALNDLAKHKKLKYSYAIKKTGYPEWIYEFDVNTTIEYEKGAVHGNADASLLFRELKKL